MQRLFIKHFAASVAKLRQVLSINLTERIFLVDIRFYNFDFTLLHIEPEIISSNWTVLNNGVGSFEIHLPLKNNVVSLLDSEFDIDKNKMMVIVQGNMQGIITSFLLEEDCAIFGKTCNWLLEKRVVCPFKSTDISADKISGADIAAYCAQTAFADVPQFCVAQPEGFDSIFGSSKMFWRNVCHPLENVVKDIMDECGGGHFLLFDTSEKKWVLHFTKNRETSLIVSACLGNTASQEYCRSADGYASDGWYEEEVFDDEGLLVGFKWKHIVKEEKNGIYRFETILDSSTKPEAEAMLIKKKKTESVYTETIGLEFEKDFLPGDIVCVQYEFGNLKNNFKRIVNGASLSFENGMTVTRIDFKEV